MSAPSPDVKSAFDAAAEAYDGLRRQLIPCFDDFYGLALAQLDAPRDQPLRVLDLGAGTGLLAGLVAAAFPQAQLTLVDLSEEMLDKARQRFARQNRPAEFRVADYVQENLGEGWDAIVSALSIHHLSDEDKQALYGNIALALKPGGVFVNAEQVLGETPAVEEINFAWWLSAIRALGVSEDEVARALDRMRHDRMATVEAQLGWLRAAGLQDVACTFKYYRFAVFGGRRAAL